MSKNKISEKVNSAFAALSGIRGEVEKDGWKKYSVGSTPRTELDPLFDLYIRVTKLEEIEDKSKMSSFTESSQIAENLTSQATTGFDGLVSNTPLGSKRDLFDTMTPVGVCDARMVSRVEDCVTGLREGVQLCREDLSPIVRRVDTYPSLAAIRPHTDGVVIAYDARHCIANDGSFVVLSWHFAVIVGERVVEFLFLRKSAALLTLETALGRIYDYIDVLSPVDVRGVRRYCSLSYDGRNAVERKYGSRNDAVTASEIAYDDGKTVHTVLDWSAVNHLRTVLLCYAGAADISAFDQRGAYSKDILARCRAVHDGTVMMQSEYIYPDSLNPRCGRNQNKYPLTIQVADAICHAPGKKRKLKDLCHAVGLDDMFIDTKTVKMDVLLQNDPRRYFQFSSCTCLAILLYTARLYGYNAVPPVTLISAAAKVMRDKMAKTLGCETVAEFDRIYRGVQPAAKGKIKKKDRPCFLQNSSLESINDKARTVQIDFSGAFHGGYNMSSSIGYFPKLTFEYDLRSAYATAMCIIPDVDWEQPFTEVITNRELTIQDFRASFALPFCNPFLPMFACVDFEFPNDVKYPCIPIDVDGVPVYPLSSRGIHGVYTTGPELYLALMLGAKINVQRGYILRPALDPKTGSQLFSLRAAEKQLVVDRSLAAEEFGKKSIEALTLKEMVASGYGKIAQNVSDKYEDSEGIQKISSPITNPVAACLITSVVRCELIAALNQISEAGFHVYSATTDGFITDAPKEKLDALDLYGFKRPMEFARLFLTDGKDPSLFDTKHQQTDLLNLSTRCYVSMSCDEDMPGVCAHGNLSVEFEKNSLEDRHDFYYKALTRTGGVECKNISYTSLGKLKNGEAFKIMNQRKIVSLDFDMKRKPVMESFRKTMVPFESILYEIANFETEPYTNITEYREYLKMKDRKKCLRTLADWESFRSVEETHTKSANKIRDTRWSILFSCVAGHRAGFWEIPMLDSLTGDERIAWVNKFAENGRLFKINDWKNAGRKDRRNSILPYEAVKEKLHEMQRESHSEAEKVS